MRWVLMQFGLFALNIGLACWVWPSPVAAFSSLVAGFCLGCGFCMVANRVIDR
jgi:4-hydroxybenzoate polyprenyltransferase